VNNDQIEGGCILVQAYLDTNIFFIVKQNVSSHNVLYVYDTEQKKILSELNYSSPITYLKSVGNWLIVAETGKLYVLNFEVGLEKVLEAIDIPQLPMGTHMIDAACSGGDLTLIFPSKSQG